MAMEQLSFYFLDEAGPLSVNEGCTEISFRNRVA
jgi:hypothetical protein